MAFPSQPMSTMLTDGGPKEPLPGDNGMSIEQELELQRQNHQKDMVLYSDLEDFDNGTKGEFYHSGNQMTMMEKRETKLMWERPMFKQDRKGDYQPARLTYDVLRLRSDETVGYGKRRQQETRKFKHEFPERIKEMQARLKREEEERNKEKGGAKMRMRWWWKKTAVELRDPLKMLRFNNFTFKPEELMSAKDIVFLQLTGCRLGDDAMSWVSAFMQQSYTLKRISLQANQITTEGCNELFLGLRTTKTLLEFDISMNPIGDDGCATICNALNENSRWSKVYTVNFSCCKLSPAAGFHLGRLIRDFKPLQALLAWRNNLGCLTLNKVGGVASIFEELRSNTTMKLINLTANEISDSDAAFHANFREIEIRRRSSIEQDKKSLQTKVEDLTKSIKVKRREAVWDDQRVEIAGLEKELNELRSKLRVAATLEARNRTKAQKEEMAYTERVRKGCGGAELINVKVKPRLILTGNHSIRRSTMIRLAAFYDLAAAPDANEFVMRRRRFDNIVTSRTEVGNWRTYVRRDHDQFDAHNVFGWDAAFDPHADHARRTIVLDWREEQRVAALNAKAVKFEKFSLDAPKDVPLGKDGKPLKMRSGGIGIASGVNDNIRDEKSGDRIAKKREEIKVRREEAEKARIKKKVTVEQEVEVEVVRVGKDGKAKSTTTSEKTQFKGHEEEDVSVADFKKLEATLDRNTERPAATATTTTTTATAGGGGAGGDDDDDFPDHKEEETLPPPRSASSAAMPTAEEDEEVNDAEGFDFDAYEDAEDAENDMLAQLLGREDEKTEAEKMAEKNEQRLEELKAKLQNKKQTTPRTEAPVKLVVASAADVTENLAGEGSIRLGRNPSFNLSAANTIGGGSSGPNSNTNTPRGDGNSPPNNAEASSPTIASRDNAISQSVLQVVESSGGAGGAEAEGGAPPPEVPAIPNISESDAHPETQKVMDIIENIEKIKAIVIGLSEKGSPSDEDLANLEKEKQRLGEVKMDAAKTISGFTTAAVLGPNQINAAWDFIDNLIRDTDIPPGNAELLASFLMKVATDYPTLVEERGLAAMAAADSSIGYLRLLLSVPELRLDVVDVVSSCFFNQSARIPLSLLILSQPANVVDLESAAEELSFMWQEFFEDCASKKRSIPREDRTGRLELLTAMLECPHFTIDIEAEGGDGQSILFRACVEGDLELLDLLLKSKEVKEPNVARSSGMTVFHAAVVGNDAQAVELLLQKVPGIDLHAKSENGNAMDLAKNLGRDPAIVKILEAKGVKASGAATKVKAAPKKGAGKKTVGKKPAAGRKPK